MSTSLHHNISRRIIIQWIIVLVLQVGCFPSIIHFFVWIFIRDYVFALWKCPWLLFIMWFHESDSFKFMWICGRVSWLFDSVSRIRRKCLVLDVCACVCSCACVVHTIAYFLKLRSREPPSAAESVQRLLMQHLKEQIIAVSSASVPVWNSQISRLFQLCRKTIKLLSSGSANKHKLTMNKCLKMYVSQQKQLQSRLMGCHGAPWSWKCADIPANKEIQAFQSLLCPSGYRSPNVAAFRLAQELWVERPLRERISRPYPGPASKCHAKGQMQWFYTNGL